MGVRIRDWIVALSLAAALGMLVGGVYSGVTGWQGPAGGMAGGSSSTRTTASAGSGLPTPNELPSATGSREPAATVPAAQVWTVEQQSPAAPATRTTKDKPGKGRDCQGEDGDGGKPDCGGGKSGGGDGGKPKSGHAKSQKHGQDRQGNG